MSSSLWAYVGGRDWTLVPNVLSCSAVDPVMCHPHGPAVEGLSQLLGCQWTGSPLGTVSMAEWLCLPGRAYIQWLTNVGEKILATVTRSGTALSSYGAGWGCCRACITVKLLPLSSPSHLTHKCWAQRYFLINLLGIESHFQSLLPWKLNKWPSCLGCTADRFFLS